MKSEPKQIQVRDLIVDSCLHVANSALDPGRISTAVQNRANTDYVRLDAVINRNGETFTQTAVISENLGVNTTVNG